jgi:hypothetical protein
LNEGRRKKEEGRGLKDVDWNPTQNREYYIKFA